MGRINVEDDSVRRFVVRHYRFDLARHERRHVVVAAFDNEAEYMQLLDSIQRDIERRITAGDFVDPNEHASGVCLEPGHARAAASGRFVSKALRHGVTPGPWLNAAELPSNMWVMQVEDATTDEHGQRSSPRTDHGMSD